jgi:predicted phage terminase large subunit-like protein
MSLRPEYATIARRAVSEQRRLLGSKTPQRFARVYLAEMFSAAPSRMHEELFAQLADLHTRRGSHLAIAAPRGHAKSTVVTLAYALWALLCGRERLVIVASGTADQAKKLLEHIKRQLETNPLLLEDFPELVGARKAAPWRRDGLRLPNDHVLLSYAAGQNLRGVRHGKDRPTLIIADDLEDKLQVASEEQRHKLRDWFNSTLLKAGTPETNAIVVGTVFHHDSLLANLLDPAKSPGWKGLRYQAVESFASRADLWERWGAILRSEIEHQGASGPAAAERFLEQSHAAMQVGARVLWPEVYPYTELMRIRMREGESAFAAEFQNDPLDPEQCLFSRSPMVFWDDRFATPEELMASFNHTTRTPKGSFYGACDPSLGGNPTRGDYSAIVVLFQPFHGETRYVIAADLARRTPDETIERILHYARLYRFTDFAIEANQFQELMVDNLRRRAKEARVAMPVTAIQSRSGKQARIAALEPEITQGRLVFARQHQMLMSQLRAFPLAKHDDGPDALEMALHAIQHQHLTMICDPFGGHVYYDSRFGGPPPPEFQPFRPY